MQTFLQLLSELAREVLAGRITLKAALHMALARLAPGPISPELVQQLDNQIRAIGLQDLRLALVLAQLNAELAGRQSNQGVRGNCLGTLGWMQRESNQLDAALASYGQARQMFEQIPPARAIVAEICRDIGMIYQRQERLGAAEQAYAEMGHIAQELGRPDLLGDALNRRGMLRLLEGRLDEALQAFQAALAGSFYPEVERSKATILSNRGVAHQLLGQLDAAERDHLAALEISQRLAEHNLRAGVDSTRRFVDQERIGRHQSDLGSVLLARGQLGEALRQLTDAIAIARATHDRAGEQQRADRLGSVYLALARRLPQDGKRQKERERWMEQASSWYHQAIVIAEERNDERGSAAYLLNLGNVYAEQGQPEEARRCYEQAGALAHKHALADTSWRVEYTMGNLLAAEGKPEEAYKRYSQAIGQAEAQRSMINLESRANFWNERVALYKRAALCCLQLPLPDRLWLALGHTEQSRARYLADKLRLEQPADAGVAIQAVRERLDRTTAVVVFNLTEEATLALIVCGPRAAPAQAALHPDWQVSEDGTIRARRFDSFKLSTLQEILFGIDSSGAVRGGYLGDYYRKLGGSGRVDQDRAAHEWSSGSIEPALEQIYTALIGAIDQALEALAIEQVILMPNLGMALLPLHACRRSGGEQFLERYTVQYAMSFATLDHGQSLAQRDPGATASLLAIKNPTHDPNLPWTELEVALIAGRFPDPERARVLSGHPPTLATPAAVLAAAPEHSYLHFSCHGRFELGDLLRSALFLVDDPAGPDLPVPESPLTLAVIMDQLRLPATRLVVISACETGMADPSSLADEYFSLAAGFIKAGAPAVVASLWQVEDLATTLLMDHFYQRHMGDGQAPATALRAAQRWLRDLTFDQWAEYNRHILKRLPRAFHLFERERKSLLEWKRQELAQAGHDSTRAGQARPFADAYYWAAFTLLGE